MITLYSKPNCPYCENAKAWLTKHGFQFEAVDITAVPEAREFVVERGHKTVPQLYVGDKILVEGGFSGLNALSPEEVSARLDVLGNVDGW